MNANLFVFCFFTDFSLSKLVVKSGAALPGWRVFQSAKQEAFWLAGESSLCWNWRSPFALGDAALVVRQLVRCPLPELARAAGKRFISKDCFSV